MTIKVAIGDLKIELSGAVTHERYQEAIKLKSLLDQLRDVQELIIQESANGASLQLRRLREKAKRLQTRIAAQRAILNG